MEIKEFHSSILKVVDSFHSSVNQRLHNMEAYFQSIGVVMGNMGMDSYPSEGRKDQESEPIELESLDKELVDLDED